MKSALTILIFTFSFVVSSQIQMKNTILVTPDSAVAYLYESNYLEFQGLNPEKEYFLLCDRDILKTADRSKFIFNPKRRGKHTLQLFENKKSIKEFPIRVESLAPIKVQLRTLKDSVVSAYELINNLYFNLAYAPQLRKVDTHVIGCSFKIKKASEESLKLVNRDSIIDEYLYSLETLMQIIEYAKIEDKDVRFLENNIKNASSFYNMMPLFHPEDIVEITQLKDGDLFIVNTVTTQCPSSKALKRSVNLRFTIMNN